MWLIKSATMMYKGTAFHWFTQNIKKSMEKRTILSTFGNISCS